MTTLAYRDGVLAMDRQACEGHIKYALVKYRKHGHRVFAVAGCLGIGLAAVDWLLAGAEVGKCPLLADAENDTDVIELSLESGECWTWEYPGVRIPVRDRIAAWGSGAEVAIGAMAAGATPKEAVRIASAWTTGSGFGVDVFTAKAQAPRKRRKRATPSE
jgi:hypothetical protein